MQCCFPYLTKFGSVLRRWKTIDRTARNSRNTGHKFPALLNGTRGLELIKLSERLLIMSTRITHGNSQLIASHLLPSVCRGTLVTSAIRYELMKLRSETISENLKEKRA